MSFQIPEINVAPLFEEANDEGVKKVAEHLQEVYTNTGFAYLSGHGISPELIEQAFSTAKAFYKRPLTYKQQYTIIKESRTGFMAAQDNIFKHSGLGIKTKANHYENFRTACYVKDHLSMLDEKQFKQKNLWPDEYEASYSSLKTLIQQQLVLFEKLLHAFAIAFKLEKHALDQYFKHVDLGFKLQYYPAMDSQDSNQQWALVPHIDYGFLTLLISDSAKGLQLQDEKGIWHDVPFQAGKVLLNSGETMQRFTNKQYLATKHRVVLPKDQERYSMPLFLNPRGDAMIAPLPTFITAEQKAQYSAIQFDELLSRYLG